MKLKAIRNLIDHSILASGRITRVVNAILEADAIETTFAEIAKLQQRILGDSKTIGGTAHNTTKGKICPKSAVLRKDGSLVCVEDGEPCGGHDKDCFDDK